MSGNASDFFGFSVGREVEDRFPLFAVFAPTGLKTIRNLSRFFTCFEAGVCSEKHCSKAS